MTAAAITDYEPITLTARREVRMPSEDILAAGAEDDWYHSQLPAGWIITDAVPDSACDGWELVDTEYIGHEADAHQENHQLVDPYPNCAASRRGTSYPCIDCGRERPFTSGKVCPLVNRAPVQDDQPQPQPVNTDSLDYQVGYQQGWDSGVSYQKDLHISELRRQNQPEPQHMQRPRTWGFGAPAEVPVVIEAIFQPPPDQQNPASPPATSSGAKVQQGYQFVSAEVGAALIWDPDLHIVPAGASGTLDSYRARAAIYANNAGDYVLDDYISGCYCLLPADTTRDGLYADLLAAANADYDNWIVDWFAGSVFDLYENPNDAPERPRLLMAIVGSQVDPQT